MLKLLSLHQGHGPFAVLQNNHYVLVCCMSFHDTSEIRNMSGSRNFHAAIQIADRPSPEICTVEDFSHIGNKFFRALYQDLDLLKTIVGLHGEEFIDRKISSVQVLRVHDRAGLLLDQLNICWPVSPATE